MCCTVTYCSERIHSWLPVRTWFRSILCHNHRTPTWIHPQNRRSPPTLRCRSPWSASARVYPRKRKPCVFYNDYFGWTVPDFIVRVPENWGSGIQRFTGSSQTIAYRRSIIQFQFDSCGHTVAEPAVIRRTLPLDIPRPALAVLSLYSCCPLFTEI